MFGYEGLAETVTSTLLTKTNAEELGFRTVPYRMERLEVRRRTRNGCSSPNFLMPGEAIMTLSQLLWKGVGPDWQAAAGRLPNLRSWVQWIAERAMELTGLDRFGEYLTLLFEIDMLFGNEDRHLNNIAVLRTGESFDYCPLFDFGAGLLSNVRDYSMDIVPKSLMGQLRAQPLGTTFTRQVHAAQSVYGPQLKWSFTSEDLAAALDGALGYYAQRDVPYIRDRVEACIRVQQKKLML